MREKPGACVKRNRRTASKRSASRLRTSRSGFRRRCTFVLLAVLVWLAVSAASASEFRRKSWTTEQGAPADIWALAQGRDGWLWLGTGNGLYRFDGVRFERFEPPADESFRSNNITALNLLPDGTLWIGFYYGGASVVRDGHVRSFPPGATFPGGMVLTFAQTPDGATWAATEGGLARFDGREWKIAGSDWGYPAPRADWAIVARDGTLWVTTGQTLMSLRSGASRFEDTGLTVTKYAVVAEAPDGTLWLSDRARGTRALPGLDAGGQLSSVAAAPQETRYAESYRLLFDRYGNLWGSDAGKGGVYRVADAARAASGRSLTPQDVAEVVDRNGGLVSDRAVPLLEDAEGTIWVGTNIGLVSFHRNRLLVPGNIVPGTASTYAMAVDREGVAWLVNGGAVWRMDGVDGEAVARGLPDISGALFDAAGTLWLIGRESLFRLRGGVPDPVALPLPSALTKVNAMAFDGRGDLWLALAEHGLYRLRDGNWSPLDAAIALPAVAPTALASDAAGRLWIGYPDDRIAVLDGDAAHVHAGGLHVGNVTTINAAGRDVLIGGELGLARLREGRIQSLVAGDDEALCGISGIVETAAGDLWLNVIKGVVRLDAGEAAAAFERPGYRPAYRLFDYRDGLPGVAVQATPVASAAVDAAHRIWFLTNQAPAWLDPARLSGNLLPPPVEVLSLSANGARYPLAATPRLPQGTNNLQIEYTATSLAIPDRVRFRYKLDGVDADWRDAGTRREASYSNLRPGSYRFQVAAANDDGVWNAQGASAQFVIEPSFFETKWFYAIWVLAVLGLAAILYFWRVRLAIERARLQLTERMRERERIARDIHDTLLQGVQGLLLRLQAVVVGLPADDSRGKVLQAAIEQARQMVIEGRDKIIALRGEDPRHTELAQSILAIGENLASTHPLAFHLTTEGQPRVMLPSAVDEIIDIVGEAVRNAFVHSQGTRVDVHVAYRRSALNVHILDDGRGIDAAAMQSAARLKRWGIVGMKERAEKLGSRLVLRPRAPAGTEVVLSVPCRAAYPETGRFSWRRHVREQHTDSDPH